MSLKGDSNRYGALAATFHWLTALGVLAMIPLGFTAAHTSDPARAAALLRLHLPLGLIILGLTLGRAAWRLIDLRPAPPAGQPRWQNRLAQITHILLYVLPILLGGSGIGLVAISRAAPAIFSGAVASLPNLPAFPPFKVHAASAFVLVALLVLHVGAVGYHQLWRRDRLLVRMRLGASTGAV